MNEERGIWGHQQTRPNAARRATLKNGSPHRNVLSCSQANEAMVTLPSPPRRVCGVKDYKGSVLVGMTLEGVCVTWPDYFALSERVVVARWGFRNNRLLAEKEAVF